MAYDAVAASVELIGSRSVQPVSRLSRRRRFTAMSVDVGGDVAVTTFARRGVGRIWYDQQVLAFRGGRWVWLGGGSSSSSGRDDLLDNRPTVLPSYLRSLAMMREGVDPPAMVILGGGGVQDDDFGPHGRWISYADVRVTAAVETIAVGGRVLDVPWHGRLAVVWTGPAPAVTAVDSSGRALANAVPDGGTDQAGSRRVVAEAQSWPLVELN